MTPQNFDSPLGSKESKFIRDTAAIANTTIARELHPDPHFRVYKEFDEWPDLMDTLLSLLNQHQNDKHSVVLTSILALLDLLCHGT